MSHFESLEAFRAHCGKPTRPLERCPICSAIPERCYRDHDGHEDTAPVEVGRLVTFIDGPSRSALQRCPTCQRLYHYIKQYEFRVGSTHNVSNYQRMSVDRLFRTEWAVTWRLPYRNVATVNGDDYFRHHAIVRFRQWRAWHSLDEANRLVELNGATFRSLIASDPPTRHFDVGSARRYAEFVCEVEDPNVQHVSSFSAIRWREPLTDEDRQQIEAARAASRIEEPTTERVGNDIAVRLWVVSKQRLICRILTISKTGDYRCEDAVIVENLPVEGDTGHSAERLDTASPLTADVDEALIAVILDALGCAAEPVHRGPKPLHPELDRTPRASSYEETITTTYPVDTAGCTIQVERTESYFPGDVNEPPRAYDSLILDGVRRDQRIAVRVHAGLGGHELAITIIATPADRDRALGVFLDKIPLR